MRDEHKRLVLKMPKDQQMELNEAFGLFIEGERDQKERDPVTQLFSGKIPSSEVRVLMRALGTEMLREDVKKLLAEVDPANVNSLDIYQFLLLIQLKQTRIDSYEEVLKAFRIFDCDDTGYVTVDKILKVAQSIQFPLSQEQAELMILEADRDLTGRVCEEEFFRVMKKAYALMT